MSTPEVACPTCGVMAPWSSSNPYRPFCSERCKMVDLGAWFSEERAIPEKNDPTSEQWDDDDSVSSFSPGDPSTPQ